MKLWAMALFLVAAAPARGGQQQTVRFSPILADSAVIAPFRHAVDIRLDLVLDGFDTGQGTETLKTLYTRAQPRLEYRYAPSDNAEVFFRGLYTAQNIEMTAADGRQLPGRYSAGMSAPTAGFKLLLSKRLALAMHTTLPTAASRDPRLGDGTHDGVKLLYSKGRWHAALGHTVRLPYMVHSASQTFRRDAGDVTEFTLATTKRNLTLETGRDYVGPVAEVHALYADRERINGQGTPASAALTGKAAFGFVLGKINRHATHLTSVAVAVGFGDVLHKTEDPLFGVGDVQLLVGYALHWDRRE